MDEVTLVTRAVLAALAIAFMPKGSGTAAPDAGVPPQKWNICWSATGSQASALVATPEGLEVQGRSDAGTGFTVCAIAWPTDPKAGFQFRNPFTGCGIEVMPVPEALEAP
jgi:hypothetical protein